MTLLTVFVSQIFVYSAPGPAERAKRKRRSHTALHTGAVQGRRDGRYHLHRQRR